MVFKKETLLGQALIDKKLISQQQLDAALKEQKKTGGFLGNVLVGLGYISQDGLLRVLAEQLGVEFVKLRHLNINPAIIEKVPAKFASHYKIIPIDLKDGVLTIAVTNPLDIHAMDDIKLILGFDTKPVLAGEDDIVEAIRKYYGIGAETLEKMMAGEEIREEAAGFDVGKSEDAEDMAQDASIIKFVNQIFLQAYRDRATDIHIEPYEDEMKVRYRIDGILYDTTIPPSIKHFQSAINSRIKIMANLNIAERRLPQDGRIRLKLAGEDLDLRVSILPTPFGESVDIRILSTGVKFSLESLGLLKRDQVLMEEIIKKPHGIVFVTGPTGSGKTTTLYACLNKINIRQKKIITIEDPIEYQIKGVTQIQVQPRIGLTFAQGLRSMLRHDPDIMMVGEVRDFETAEITIRVALTGHLVFSTLHTNDASGGVTRLLDMGIEPYLAASSVECFIAQRLVRVICSQCKKEVKPSKEVLRELGVEQIKDISKIKFYEGQGCDECKQTGYMGRTAIYEILFIDTDIRDLILARQPADKIKEKGIEKGMRTLRQDGWEKIKRGVTTPSEVLRVTEAEVIE
ncbi:MAG: Flp pilus assembly complex ATPase component TadA [Candidatus Omnitrophica bacterium]|nr:Flp pilus assembly complex ATPase component TadA [Candidatus Omnitrophota bacterium]